MGNKNSRVIEVDNIQDHLNQCQQLGRRNCSIYGSVHLVKYNGMEFMLSEAREGKIPPLGSLHYLVPPNLLVVPEFTLLEDTNPIEVDDLIDIIVGVAELCRDCDAGIGRGRIGFAGKWGIVGQKSSQWAYQEAFSNSQAKGVYLPPQQMISLSQGRPYRKSNRKKSDVFALGFMTLELIFKVNLSDVFCYKQFEMFLGPVLDKLKTIKVQFGETLSNIIMGMIQLDEENRLDFDELLQMIAQARGVTSVPQSNRRGSVINNIPNVSENSNICRTPTNKSPHQRKSSVVVGNHCSPFKIGGCSDNVRTPQRLGRTGKTPERGTNNFKEIKVSPLKRDLRINTRFDKENKLTNTGYYQSNKSPLAGRKTGVSPLSRR